MTNWRDTGKLSALEAYLTGAVLVIAGVAGLTGLAALIGFVVTR